jgi:hypothetical protein
LILRPLVLLTAEALGSWVDLSLEVDGVPVAPSESVRPGGAARQLFLAYAEAIGGDAKKAADLRDVCAAIGPRVEVVP